MAKLKHTKQNKRPGSIAFTGLMTLCLAVLGTANTISAIPANAQMPIKVQEKHKTFLVNGLASVMPFVGYGFKNLKGKLSDAQVYEYATPLEGRAVVQPAVRRAILQAWRADPKVKINLIGISYGGNIVASLAAQLNKEGIPVNYLGILDGPMLKPITPNVHRVDNFVCNRLNCIGAKVRLARGNRSTIKAEFNIPSTHIALADNAIVHDRILDQFTSYAMVLPEISPATVYGTRYPANIDPVTTATVPANN